MGVSGGESSQTGLSGPIHLLAVNIDALASTRLIHESDIFQEAPHYEIPRLGLLPVH